MIFSLYMSGSAIHVSLLPVLSYARTGNPRTLYYFPVLRESFADFKLGNDRTNSPA